MVTKLSIEQIEYALTGGAMSPFYLRRYLVVPNVDWGLLNHEADLIAMSKAGYLTEIEIKRSWHDFLNDFKKRHTHNDNKITQLYYAVPEKIIQKVFDTLYIGELKYNNTIAEVKDFTEKNPNKCGLIVYYEDGYCRILVTAQKINNYKLNEKEQMQLMRLGCMRVWGLKKKVSRLQSLINSKKQLLIKK